MTLSRSLKVVFGVIVVAVGCLLSFTLLSLPERAEPSTPQSYGGTVEEGRYLARAGNCAACHTAEGGEPYAGGVPFVTPFGVLYSTNITSDAATGIGNWSFADFYNSMKHGVRPDGAHLYPAFPYTDFAHLTDKDLASLYLFMQTVEPVEAPALENDLDFPFDNRALLTGWKAVFHNAETFEPRDDKTDQWNRGAYLVEGPGHCGACHTPRNVLGAEKPALAFTGGVYQDKVRFGYHRQWSGVNLTSHQMGLASWSEQDIFDYLKGGISDKAVVHGPMKEVVLGSTSHLTDEDIRAMAVYLKDLPAKAQPPGPTPDAEQLAAGEIVYTVHCGSCHLPGGDGDQGLGVPLVDNPIVQAPDPSSLINVILYGPHMPRQLVVDRSNMKMFGKRLSDEDIANAATYVRTEFGNGAGAVTPEEVNRQR